MGIEDLQYGDTYELRNGDSCVYVCRNLGEETDDETQLLSLELILINTFTGEEHNINDYNDDLTHCEDEQLDIIDFEKGEKVDWEKLMFDGVPDEDRYSYGPCIEEE